MTTKKQEREALEQIKKIVSELGDGSYIGTALDGCLEDAETNIEYDYAESMKARWLNEVERREGYRAKCEEYEETISRLTYRVQSLEASLEREQEWQPYEFKRNVAQSDYDRIASSSGVRELTDDEAADMIAGEFGFERSKIRIVREAATWEINRHRQCRQTGTTPRKPLFEAWDMNYIAFKVLGVGYEMHDGDLSLYFS